VDGHGIRTTVFLKGCPLRCLWCCNPEGQAAFREIKLSVALCNGCGQCVGVCTKKAIKLSGKKDGDKIIIDRKSCDNCGKCLDVCFTGALGFFGIYYTVDELFAIVEKDKAYYRSSGGGVTLGGGEPTFQAKFTRAFLKKCRENYLHTALDTCGYTLKAEGVKALEEADLLLFDLKGLALELHRKNTGAANDRILSNLKHLDEIGKDIIVRLPIIPGHTDSAKNLRETAEFLSRLKSVERVDLLAYHEYGTIKYRELGREYALHLTVPSTERMEEIKALFEGKGLKVQLGG
jgi:pyruvate formate lyase activating enzyme